MSSDPAFHPDTLAEAPAAAIRIRPFDRTHAAAARDLFIRCFEELAPPAMRPHLGAYLARNLEGDYRDIAHAYPPGRGSGFWLALSPDGALLGTFALKPQGEAGAELRRMYVDPAARRRGVARAMLAEAEALCAAWGVRRLFLTTSSLNQAAIALYRRAGYRQADYRPEGTPPEPLPPGLRVFSFEKALAA